MTNKKKRYIAGLLIGAMLFSLAGCKKKNDDTTEAVPTIDLSTETTSQPDIEVTTEDPSVDLTSPEAIAEQERFDEYVMDSFKTAITSDSISLHYYLANPETYGITAEVATLGDAYCLSDEAIADERAEAKADKEEFEGFNYSLLTPAQKFDYNVYKYAIDASDEYYDYYYLQEPFAYTSGLHSNMPINYSEYVFRSADDIPMYLDLLELLPAYVEDTLAFEKIRVDKGLFMNRHSANEVIRQCNEFIADPEHNLLIETFNAKVDALDDLDAATAEEYKARNYDIVMNKIIPSYKGIISFFTDNKTKGKNDLGLCYLDNGKAYYAYLLNNQTGTSRTPEEAIELLDKYMNKYMGELQMTALGNYEAYTAFLDEMDTVYSDVDPDETLRYFEEEFKTKFPELPRFEYNISNVHESLQDIVSPAFYMLAPIDNYKENSIRLNITDDVGNDLWSTLCHEGIPGHMYQRNYYLQTNPAPYRAIMSQMGYTEGWATYVQFMSYALYDYKDPIYADLSRLNTQLGLILQARIDLGVNYEGWDKTETENYLERSGFNKEVAEDVMNYVIAEPANYQAYVIGWLEFEELRDKAQTVLGDKFDEVEFHRAVLDAGPCPFSVLETKVNEYIVNNQ